VAIMKTLSDITAPATVTRKLLEKDVQKQCVDWARARGYWARKFSSMTSTAEPDYLFAKSDWGVIGDVKFACEFKAPGKTSTDAQIEEQGIMRLAGWYVFECDSFNKFKQIVHAYEREQQP